MAYEEPGVIVIQEPVAEPVNVQAQSRALTLIAPLWEVHEDDVAAEKYDPLPGAGDTTVAWPKTKTTSVVDLQGIRKSTAEPDSQLLDQAEYPMSVKLRDPTTNVTSDVDILTDVDTVDQDGFNIVESSGAATARVNVTDSTAAEEGKVRIAAGGLVAAGVAVGDKVAIGAPISKNATVLAFTDDELTYSTGIPADVDAVDLSGDEGDARTAGTFSDIAGAPVNFTGKEGGRLVAWVEEQEVDDGVADGTNTLSSATFALTAADVGKKATIHDLTGAVTWPNGDLDTPGGNVLSDTTNNPFSATDLGKVIRITVGVTNHYRRIVRVISASDVEYSGSLLAGTGITYIMYVPTVRNITDVPTATQITVDGGAILANTDLPIVVHRPERRDIATVVSNTSITYGGTALTSDTGFLLRVPFETFEDDITVQVFPDYDVLVTFRALEVDSLDDPIRVGAPSELNALGTPSNPASRLLFGAQAALTAMGTTDREILLMPLDLWADDVVRSGYPEDQDVLSGHQAAQEVLEALDEPYHLVVDSKSGSVRDSWVSHVNAQSTEVEKHWRTAFLVYELPNGEYESTQGVIAPGADGGNKRITEVGAGFVTTHGLIPGKEVVVLFPTTFAGTYTVAAGSDDDNLELEGDNWGQDSGGSYLPAFSEFEVTDASFGGTSGITGSIDTVLAGTVTISGLTDMQDVDVGRNITISGATTGANNGTFPITAVLGPGSVQYTNNAAVAPDASNPNIVWSVAADGRVGTQVANAWKDVEPGDYILVGSATRRITAVSANFRELTYDAPLFTGVNQTVSVVRSYDPAYGTGVQYYADPLSRSEQATALAAISTARANRRIVHVWPDQAPMVTGTDQQGNDVIEQVDSFFSACALAGQKSVLQPPRSSTGLQLPGLTGELQNSSRFFKRSELNTIAGAGWTILEQRNKNGPITVRHLLTTDTSLEKFQEYSITNNIDAISKDAVATMEPLLTDSEGRINISTDYLSFLRIAFQGFLESQAAKPLDRLVDTEDAPAFQILSFGVSPTSPTKIETRVALNVPFPANNLEITLEF